MKRITSALIALGAIAALCAAPLTGPWKGTLKVGQAKLALVIHLPECAADTCLLDSPDQNAFGLHGVIAYNDGDSIATAFPDLLAYYCARLENDTLRGTFTQRGMNFPLSMTRGEVVRQRPQTPQPPFPYTEKELTFKSQLDSATLCGTLTIPDEPAEFPLVVMLSGSGQQNRDEELLGHRPFAVLADRLARAGIASFRYDDRGVECSKGLREDITTLTNMEDAYSALMMLKAVQPAESYGLLGHSEGGLMAFMMGARHPEDVDFIVSLAGPAVRGDSIVRPQLQRAMPGMSDQQIEEYLLMAMNNPWMAYFCTYDPTPDLEALKCPVLAMQGMLDQQVYPAINLPALKEKLAANPEATIREYPGLNHLFQHAPTGSPQEYGDIEETMAPDAIAAIIDWILSL